MYYDLKFPLHIQRFQARLVEVNRSSHSDKPGIDRLFLKLNQLHYIV